MCSTRSDDQTNSRMITNLALSGSSSTTALDRIHRLQARQRVHRQRARERLARNSGEERSPWTSTMRARIRLSPSLLSNDDTGTKPTQSPSSEATRTNRSSENGPGLTSHGSHVYAPPATDKSYLFPRLRRPIAHVHLIGCNFSSLGRRQSEQETSPHPDGVAPQS